jgi:threonine 3-dehydrogenase
MGCVGEGRYRLPVALGHEFCGDVVEVGPEVHHVSPGDRVSAETHLTCGHCRQCRTNRQHTCENLVGFSQLNRGAFADYTTVPAKLLRPVPVSMSDEQAALLEPLGVAVRSVMDHDLRGATIVVTGCGPIGLLTVAVANACGVAAVFASDLSRERLALAKRLGAARVFHAQDDDLKDAVFELTAGAGADVAIEASGSPQAVGQALSLVARGGRLLLTGVPRQEVSLDVGRYVLGREVTIEGILGRRIDETWVQMERLCARPDFDLSPLLTDTLPLSAFEAAFEAAASGASGKVSFVFSR